MADTLSNIGTLVLAGAGKMGGAMLEGWLKLGLPASSIVIRDPAPPAETLAILAAHNVPAAPAPAIADVLVIAVKPQMMDAVLPALKDVVGPDTLIISVAAGKLVGTFTAAFGSAANIVRAMPNTPAAVGRGMTVCYAPAHVGNSQRMLATSLLQAVGDVAWIDDEAQMDAVTALSGSGPAYIFLLAEAMTQAGITAGLPAELAARLARQTVAGAGELLFRSQIDAATLRKNVTSPGGTTAAALDVLMGDKGFGPLLTEAIAAAARRSKELAG